VVLDGYSCTGAKPKEVIARLDKGIFAGLKNQCGQEGEKKSCLGNGVSSGDF
jgi:hypothetical protein